MQTYFVENFGTPKYNEKIFFVIFLVFLLAPNKHPHSTSHYLHERAVPSRGADAQIQLMREERAHDTHMRKCRAEHHYL